MLKMNIKMLLGVDTNRLHRSGYSSNFEREL